MSQPPESRETEPLTYRSGKGDEFRPGATVPARIVAGACSVGFIVLMAMSWLEIDRGRPSAATFLSPAVLLCLAGSILCVLVALGIVGRHKRGWW